MDNFEELYKQRGQQKHGVRLLALWKIQSGVSEKNVCEFIGKTAKTIRTWRRTYEKEGLDALLSIADGRGRKAKASLDESLPDDIMALHESRKGGRINCRDIIALVHSKYGVEYAPSGMYHILGRLGFSWITSRSKHPKSDPEAMEAFKKTSKPKLKK